MTDEKNEPEGGAQNGKKETRGVKTGVKRGPYEKKDSESKKERDALFRRVQALEDEVASLKGGKAAKEEKRASPNAPESTNAEGGATIPLPKQEEEDWL
jgi:hypothetical protein